MEPCVVELSVIICTNNPLEEHLRRTLEALRAQTVSTSRWELLIIDNASEPPVDAGDLSWHPRARVISETIPGLSFARVRGIREAIGDLLVFVDDDNVLD